MEIAAKKIKIVKPGDNAMVPCLTWTGRRSMHTVIVEEYSNGQFKLGTRYILTPV